MTASKPEPQTERLYLEELARRAATVLGDELLGVYAGGSFALGGYEPGRSDLDVAVVVESGLAARQRSGLIEQVRHESLPCPARGLELVVYRRATAASPRPARDFELNLNSGAAMPLLLETEPGGGPDFWFPIDRSILAQAGMPLVGPPAGEVFPPIAPQALVPVLVDSIRWHRARPERPSDSVLNACRSLRFATEGRWSSKPAAGRWAVDRGLAPSELVRRACAGELGPSPELVDEFLAEVESRLSAPEGSGPPC
jgi:hypothetical protein